MGKIKVAKFISDLKFIESSRDTFYRNSYPFNCGYIWDSGYLSFDCIGLIKSYINYPNITRKISPSGFFVKPGQVIPDVGEIEILNLCTGKSSKFSKIQPGAYLLYEGYGHGGVYVGKFKDPSGIVNCIECTTDMGGGVVTSYIDKKGRRWDHKGGTCYGQWIAYGYLTPYIDYTKEKKKAKKKTPEQIAKEVIAGKWGTYPDRKKKLEKAGYNYEQIQTIVNRLLTK